MNLSMSGTNNQPSAYPATVDYIGYHAARRPDKVALIKKGQETTYAAFHSDIGKMIATLQEFGLRAGQKIGIEHHSPEVEVSNFYVHWLVVLALEALDIITLSYIRSGSEVTQKILADMDLVMHFPGGELSGVRRSHLMDISWLKSVQDREPQFPPRAGLGDPDTPLRIVMSSGTTGSPKQIMHTRKILHLRADQKQFHHGFNRHSRYYVTLGFHIQAYHQDATACVRVGGTCVYAPGEYSDTADNLVKYAITHVTFLPSALVGVLDCLPENYTKTPNLRIVTIGAPVSTAVRDRVYRLLANELAEIYSSNETSTICVMDGNGSGTIMPGVCVNIVNDEDQPVIGAPGPVRVRTPSMVSGYFGNPDSTRQKFQDGWFYPGDLAIMPDQHTLNLIGRTDDLLNAGGVKFSPQALEEKLRDNLPVKDVCLTTIADEQEGNQVWVVFVPQEPDDFSEISEGIKSLLPKSIGRSTILSVPEIPRTTTGKVQRNILNRNLQCISAKNR